ncbi:MAG: hypothetical protein K8S98_15260 [Planctomycetes bacterium]|nr:hypothetical protein [Planctomycetota bacterium]
MSELPRRPNDHLVEPMFAALGREPVAQEPRRSGRLRWIALAVVVAAAVWFLIVR